MDAPSGHQNRRGDSGLFGPRAFLWGLAAVLLAVASWFAARQSVPTSDPYGAGPSFLSRAWWLQPIEAQPWHRVPLTKSKFTSIAMDSGGQRGWAVGVFGVVVTADRGKTWTPPSVAPKFPIKSTAISGDGQRGWAVGENDIAWTEDGGKTWTKAGGDAGLGFNSTVMDSGGARGWAVGDAGIAWTDNGGRSWHRVSDAPAAYFFATAISRDGNQGWAVGRGTISWTEDGGKKWNPATGVNVGEPFFTSSAVSRDGQRGWAAGLTEIARTNDWGKTWTLAAGVPGLGFKSIATSVDGQRVWAVGDLGIASTENGGQNWRRSSRDLGGEFTSAAMSGDGQRGWVVGDGHIVWTENGGLTWHPAKGVPDFGFKGTLISGDGKYGLAVGERGIARTDDDGKTWVPLTSSPGSGFNGTAISSNSQYGWAVGEGGIAWTNDSGKTWTQSSGAQKFRFTSAAMSDDGLRGWAVGNGVIVWTEDGGNKWNASGGVPPLEFTSTSVSDDGKNGWAVAENGIAWTNDFGKSWKLVGEEPTVRPERFYFSSPDGYTEAQAHSINTATGAAISADGIRGWAVSIHGIVWTGDGGATWDSASGSTELVFRATAASVDGMRGCAVGRDGISWTDNGGRTWIPATESPEAEFTSAAMSGDGLRAWAVAWRGIAWTEDGGKIWTLGSSVPEYQFSSVAMSVDGLRGWAVGSGGIAWTEDGGKTWTKAGGDAGLGFNSTVMDSGGARGWAVGDAGIAWTGNGGRSWTRVGGDRAALLLAAKANRGFPQLESGKNHVRLFDLAANRVIPGSDQYRRYPAPWFYVAVLLCVGLALFAALGLDPPPILPPDSVEDTLASDMPVEQFENDKLGYARIAEGLARFMTNPRTEPRQAIAVSGPWGQGKSSILWLLRSRLRDWGFSTVSFNAWHHQKNEQVLPSLFAHLRRQGIPPVFSAAGLQFRLRLVWQRLTEHPVLWSLASILVLFISGTAIADPDGSGDLIRAIASFFSKSGEAHDKDQFWPHIEKLGTFGVAITIVFALWKLLTVFGIQPQDLVRRTRDQFTLRSFGSPEAARYRFAQDFRAFTLAQGIRPTTIFIDDLDRCEPKIVLEVLEVVNFLVSSGRCFVVMSLEKRWIKAAIEQEYEALAKRVDATEPLAEFSARYLEKLINIEIPVPRSRETLRKMLQRRAEAGTTRKSGWQRAGRQLRRLHPSATVLMTLVLSAAAGYWQGLPEKAGAGADAEVTSATKAPAIAVPGDKLGRDTRCVGGPAKQIDDPACADLRKAQAARQPEASSQEWFFEGQKNAVGYVDYAYPALGMIALLVIGLFAMARQPRFQTQDSPNFLKALELWTYWLVDEVQTPRAFKRFTNKVRFLAMIARQDQTLARPAGLLRRVWWTFRGRETALLDQEGRLDESGPGTVAMAAILELQPSWTGALLREVFTVSGDGGAVPLHRLIEVGHGEPKLVKKQAHALKAMINRHVDEFNLVGPTAWIPSEAQCELIEDVIVVR